MTTPTPHEARLSRPDPESLIAPVVARSRLIAVVTLDRGADGPPLARALASGGVATVEITLRTPAGLEAVRAAAAEAPQALVGAGTCLTTADLEAAKEAGAGFAVSPGFLPDLADCALALELPYLPGVADASGVMAALARGHRTLKFFPAVPAGGLAYLRALHAPFPQVRFCPTGGVTEATAAAFLAEPGVACLGGSWMAPADAVAAGDWARIERLAAAAADRCGHPCAT